MMIDDLLSAVKETLTVRRVYGEPYEKDGVTVIPAATVAGGGGGGGGSDGEGPEGQGGGFGLTVKPAGMYVIEDGTVRWKPAVDLNRLAVTVAVVAVVTALVRLRTVRSRRRDRR